MSNQPEAERFLAGEAGQALEPATEPVEPASNEELSPISLDGLNPAEAEMVSAEAEMVSAEAEMVSAEAEMVKSIANAARLKQKLTKEQVAFMRDFQAEWTAWRRLGLPACPACPASRAEPAPAGGTTRHPGNRSPGTRSKGDEERAPRSLGQDPAKPPAHPKTPRPKAPRGGQTARSSRHHPDLTGMKASSRRSSARRKGSWWRKCAIQLSRMTSPFFASSSCAC